MSDKKTLSIDPNLFAFTNNNSTKKRRNVGNDNGIKIKHDSPKKKNDSLKKKSILKMIRQHQSDRYKKLFDPEPVVKSNNDGVLEMKNDFKDAQQFFENLTERTEQKTKMNNHTLRQYPSMPDKSLLLHPSIPIMPDPIVLPAVSNLNPPITLIPKQIPQYGCLKNGSLPTYRNFMNKTQKNYLPIQQNVPFHQMGGGPTNTKPPDIASQLEKNKTEIMEKKINESMSRIQEIKQTAVKLQEMKRGGRPNKLKQKRTVKRTYKIGKSKVLPKVSVLVSNRTLRNNISTKSQFLKQVPIDEVKKYLMKRGFIKVGSSSPNDVLRKMYESAVLICGDVQNHNPDNLLYNFLNSQE
jgi:hypothetical protein